jgi:hypothetical protein
MLLRNQLRLALGSQIVNKKEINPRQRQMLYRRKHRVVLSSVPELGQRASPAHLNNTILQSRIRVFYNFLNTCPLPTFAHQD